MEEEADLVIKQILRGLRNCKCIGGAHTPEYYALKKLKYIQDKHLKKKILEMWYDLELQGIIIRVKKRTFRGSDYHVSLNPRMLAIIEEMIK